MRPLKILHLSHRFWPCLGGIETHVRQLCEKTLAKGFETRVVCLNKCPNSRKKLPASENFHGTEIRRLGFLELGFYRIAPGILRQLGECNVIHVHGLGFFSDALAKTKLLHRKKLVLSTHGGIFHTERESLLKRIYFFGWCRLALKAFDKIVAVSKQDFELFSKIVPKEKIALIENPIDTKSFEAIQRNPKENSFLFVGRLSKNKGLLNLLESFALLKENNPGFSLTIAGKDFDLRKEDLQKKAKELGIASNVSVLGRVSEKKMLELYAKNEFFVSASKYEGFGISAVEAMAAGLVPILNKIPAFEAFVKEGKNGLLADFSNSEKASAKIMQAALMPDKKKAQASASAKQFAKTLSWEKSIGKFEQVYREVLKK